MLRRSNGFQRCLWRRQLLQEILHFANETATKQSDDFGGVLSGCFHVAEILISVQTPWNQTRVWGFPPIEPCPGSHGSIAPKASGEGAPERPRSETEVPWLGAFETTLVRLR